MRSTTVTALLLGAAISVTAQSNTTPITGTLGNATITTDNPAGAAYVATLPNLATTNIRGAVTASTNAGNTGVSFQVTLDGFPTEGGPFIYHIHEYRVPANGNCTATGAHLDPFLRGESPTCDASLPMTCQVGDLSGKHGSINGTSISADYIDSYVSTSPGNAAFVGNRSIVVHYANKTRITCANFELYTDAKSASGNSNNTSTTSAMSGSSSGSSITTTTAKSSSTTSASMSSSSSAASSSSSASYSGSAAFIGLNAAALLFASLAFLI
ncbi:hypothetical protein MBLNU457_1224t1 [Dothideomycetes sp. NU457]